MTASRPTQAGEPLRCLAQLEVHHLAAQQPPLGRFGKRHPRTHEQRLDAWHARIHRTRDLLVGQAVDLAQEQRSALGLRKLLHVAHDLTQVLAHVHRLHRAAGGREVEFLNAAVSGRPPLADVLEAHVPRDAVEPGANEDLALVGHHRAIRRREHFLQHVLGVLARVQHVAAEGQEPRAVALDEGLERGLVTRPDEVDQPLVGLQPKEWRANADGCELNGLA